MPPLIAKSPTVYVEAASSSGFQRSREKILPSFALLYCDLVSFCLFHLPALSLQSHQSDLCHPLAPNQHAPFSPRVGAYCTGFSVPASVRTKHGRCPGSMEPFRGILEQGIKPTNAHIVPCLCTYVHLLCDPERDKEVKKMNKQKTSNVKASRSILKAMLKKQHISV